MRGSVISFTVRVFGTATSTPDWITGAVSMKMISSTSTTSTNGVTLMSDMDVCVLPFAPVNAISVAHSLRLTRRSRRRALDGVHELQREVIHARGELAQLVLEEV